MHGDEVCRFNVYSQYNTEVKTIVRYVSCYTAPLLGVLSLTGSVVEHRLPQLQAPSHYPSSRPPGALDSRQYESALAKCDQLERCGSILGFCC